MQRINDYIGETTECAYLEKEGYDINYQIKHKPCGFLQEEGNCKLGDCNLK